MDMTKTKKIKLVLEMTVPMDYDKGTKRILIDQIQRKIIPIYEKAIFEPESFATEVDIMDLSSQSKVIEYDAEKSAINDMIPFDGVNVTSR